MSLNPDAFRLYQSQLTALIAAFAAYAEPAVKGRAAALGTLTAILNRVNKLADAWETRAMAEVDRKDVARDISTLRWLRQDPWVACDVQNLSVDLPGAGTNLSFDEAIRVLEASVTTSTTSSASA